MAPDLLHGFHPIAVPNQWIAISTPASTRLPWPPPESSTDEHPCKILGRGLAFTKLSNDCAGREPGRERGITSKAPVMGQTHGGPSAHEPALRRLTMGR